jgi:hypothetical protein
MKRTIPRLKCVLPAINRAIAILLCLALIVWGDQGAVASAMQDAGAAERISNDQLDSLVAPIALYPDPLLSQILVASTYPLEIVQLHQWMQKNSTMSPEKMVEEVKKQDWDASVQAMVVFPDLVKILTENIRTTADIGNAFLVQQSDVMDAVQRMRGKAKNNGHLKTTEQQTVETKVIESKEVIIIEPSKTEVVYVPSYDPVVVYGAAPYYPYPAYYYPPAGYYYGGLALSFGVGMMVGAAWGGGWGWGCGWGGGNNVYINHNNNFNRNVDRQNNRGGRNQASPKGGRSNWQHNPQHRGGTPYSNRATAKQYGGTARGDSMANRQASARSNQSKYGNRQSAGVSDRSSMGSRGGDRGASASTVNRGGGGGDRIGNRTTSNGSRGSSFGSGGGSRSSSMASSSRGRSSMGGSRSGGGGMRGGGGGGGRRR